MEKDIKFFVDIPFDSTIIEGLDMTSIEVAIEEGNKCLHYQFETIDRIRARCTMILGWTVGAIVALIGFVAIEGTSETPKLTLLITAGYEILFAFAITTLIIHGALYRRNVFHPGTSPSHFCRESILTALSGIENKSKYIVGWHLADIQYRIMENAKEQMHEVSIYRKALALIAISLITGAILMTALLIYL